MVDFPVRLLAGLMNAFGLAAPTSPGTESGEDSDLSDMEPDSNSDTEEDFSIPIFKAIDLDQGDKSQEVMGLFQPVDEEEDQLLRVLPYRTLMSQSQLAKAVRRKMRGQTDEQTFIADMAAQLLAPFDPDRTQQDAWLGSSLVNKFMHDLVRRYADKKVIAIDANSTDLNLYLRNVSTQGAWKDERQRLKEANLIFWPICHNRHWYFLAIEKQGNHFLIQCLDGYNSQQFQEPLLVLGQSLVQKLYDLRKDLTFSHKNVKIPQQTNSKDGGAVICYMAEKYCQNYLLPEYRNNYCLGHYEDFAHLFCDYTQFRLHIARLFFSLSEIEFSQGWQPSYQHHKLALKGPQKAKGQQTTKEVVVVDEELDDQAQDMDSVPTGKIKVTTKRNGIPGNKRR
ncbi:MAG: hypothetical protein BGO43_12525 [Gammaproteobacteria bacterium 39-13]|nr:hypothetical protein [Gammaproteobacteria bacterium]OJV89973.1 MAG: hypothetical protein BGO43_12525 [Gammaproteobacteria bacterium 39-13]